MSILHRLKERDGGGLLDVLIGMVILTIALSSAFMLSLHASQTMRRGQHMAAAASLAEYKIEELRNASMDNIVTGSDGTALDALGNEGTRFTRSWTVNDNTPVVGLKEVTVNVNWDYNGETRLYTLTGVIGPAEVMP